MERAGNIKERKKNGTFGRQSLCLDLQTWFNDNHDDDVLKGVCQGLLSKKEAHQSCFLPVVMVTVIQESLQVGVVSA